MLLCSATVTIVNLYFYAHLGTVAHQKFFIHQVIYFKVITSSHSPRGMHVSSISPPLPSSSKHHYNYKHANQPTIQITLADIFIFLCPEEQVYSVSIIFVKLNWQYCRLLLTTAPFNLVENKSWALS